MAAAAVVLWKPRSQMSDSDVVECIMMDCQLMGVAR